MKTIMVIAIMKVDENDKDNGSNDENYDASGDETDDQSIGEIDVESDDDRDR